MKKIETKELEALQSLNAEFNKLKNAIRRLSLTKAWSMLKSRRVKIRVCFIRKRPDDKIR